MIEIPSNNDKLLALATELIEQCNVSVGMRASYYRLMNAVAETGRTDGSKSLINMLYQLMARTAAHLFSPVELKFSLDFGHPQSKETLDRAAQVGKELTRVWERNGTDITFGRGVFESLKYGAALLKQWPQQETSEEDHVTYCDALVMPWQFGVYREDENRLDRQEALCETITLTLPEVWRRIWFMPDAKKLYERIKLHAKHGEASSAPNSFFHQVLSTSQLQTGVQGATRPLPGGIVQLNNDPNYGVMGPVIAADTVQMYELWVKGEKDYVTIQVIEPDILVAPVYKRSNLLGIPNQQPYRLIQPNEVTNWFWGRSMLVDLIEPQSLLATHCDDARRLVGLQVDKILAFVGEGGITDETYGQFRGAGFINLPQGASVNDLTPKMPPELLPLIKFDIEMVNTIAGFPDIMQGKGEPGVRAGVHADTLIKTGSPVLRDQSLLIERQCAVAADFTLQMMEAKDANFYWLKADQPIEDIEKTKFMLTDLPDDWRVTVDSHSTSPIFSNETSQLILQAAKFGYVDGEYVLDNLPFPNSETAKARLRAKEASQAAFMQKLMKEHPDIADDVLKKQLTSHKR